MMKRKTVKSESQVAPAAISDPYVEDLLWNEEIKEDISHEGESEIIVYSRDWTIATIISQIEQKNIDLYPTFQRRNAWSDAKRSMLIESLISGLPVPEIVLAENPKKKSAFIVIDGKQRLLTIAGYVDPSVNYWETAELKKLELRKELNAKSYAQLKTEKALQDQHRQFINADVRCTIIKNYKSDDALYDIFYRLNTGSVPLSTQELRQVLHKGPFADYLIEITNTSQPLHRVIGTDGPDNRLRDVEIVLRFIAIVLFGSSYEGNLKKFLDDTMEQVTTGWTQFKPIVEDAYNNMNRAIANLNTVLDEKHIGRKYVNGKWELRFNRVLFEVEAFYFHQISDANIARGKKKFVTGLQELFSDSDFKSSVESTTKTNERYELRFRRFQKVVNESFGTKINNVPVVA
jgi:Protein of unknown function DUF262